MKDDGSPTCRYAIKNFGKACFANVAEDGIVNLKELPEWLQDVDVCDPNDSFYTAVNTSAQVFIRLDLSSVSVKKYSFILFQLNKGNYDIVEIYKRGQIEIPSESFVGFHGTPAKVNDHNAWNFGDPTHNIRKIMEQGLRCDDVEAAHGRYMVS